MRFPILFAFIALLTSSCGDEPRRTPPIIEEPNNGGANNGANNGFGSNNGTGESNNATANNGGTDSNNATDSNNPTDSNNASNNNDTTSNNGDTNQQTGGQICPSTTSDPFRGECDVVRNTGCPAPEQCIVALLINGPEVDVSSACLETDKHVLSEGAFCAGTEERCEPSTFCISYLEECRRLCYFEDGSGCTENEWCIQADSNWKGIGYCADACE